MDLNSIAEEAVFDAITSAMDDFDITDHVSSSDIESMVGDKIDELNLEKILEDKVDDHLGDFSEENVAQQIQRWLDHNGLRCLVHDKLAEYTTKLEQVKKKEEELIDLVESLHSNYDVAVNEAKISFVNKVDLLLAKVKHLEEQNNKLWFSKAAQSTYNFISSKLRLSR